MRKWFLVNEITPGALTWFLLTTYWYYNELLDTQTIEPSHPCYLSNVCVQENCCFFENVVESRKFVSLSVCSAVVEYSSCLSVPLSVCPSAYLSLCLSVPLPLCPSACLWNIFIDNFCDWGTSPLPIVLINAYYKQVHWQSLNLHIIDRQNKTVYL